MSIMANKQTADGVRRATNGGVGVSLAEGMPGFEELNCLGCKRPFMNPIKRGTKPNYCRRPSCREIQAVAERDRNLMAKREAAERGKVGTILGVLFENEDVRLRHRELVEVCEILAEYAPTQDSPRLELKRFVLAAARAKGTKGWRRGLLELAACAVFLASQYGDGIDRKAMVK